MLYIEIFLLMLGLVLLVKASDLLVDSISSLAVNFKMSKITIAMTVAAFATCAPELAISFNSIRIGAGDIVIANVLGSSIVNILLIIGLSSLLFPIRVKNEIIEKEAILLLAITVIFSFSIADNILNFKNGVILTRVNALLFFLLFLVFLFYILSQIKIGKKEVIKEKPRYGLWGSILITLFCLFAIVLGSDMTVDFATLIAEHMGISQKIITMTIIVIGTSLPELSMTLSSARRKEHDIAIGNIIGTNIFNIGVVLGIPILIYGNITSTEYNLIDIFVVLSSALLFFLFARNDRKLSRKEGLIMFLVFIAYYAYIFLK